MLILLDLDDTLVRRQAVFSDWAEEFASRYPDEAGLVAWLTEQDRGGWRPRQELWSLVKARLKLEPPVEQLVADWQQDFTGRFALQPDAADALKRARSLGWRLGVVTNGDARVQAAKVSAAGLDELVDAVCISGAEGIEKPDRRIFELAADRCGAELTGGWMVGDNAVADIQGAHNAGLHSVWINYGSAAWPEDLRRPTTSAATVAAAVDLVLSA
jgi:HAD superfamily hydrolase (TIGR01549 family)